VLLSLIVLFVEQNKLMKYATEIVDQ